MKNLLSILFVCLSINLSAKKPPAKWGDIPEADLKMTVYEQDPEADAVVLVDYGSVEFEINDKMQVNTFFHRRIKILKKSGFEQGDISIGFAKKNNEKIVGIKAQVILPNGEKISVSKKKCLKRK